MMTDSKYVQQQAAQQLTETASIQLASTLATEKMSLPQSETGWTRWILHL